jgi:histidyl-tRNA synthetase
MGDGPAAPRGTIDWLPPRSDARRALIDDFARLVRRARYREVATPVFEEETLFRRTAGESSEVVGKEMYAFEDLGGRTLALRPEFTAPVMRAYLEHGLSREPQPVRLWSAGSCYRYAAVQRGRYREFTQVNAEAIGSDDPAVDAELIGLQMAWYAGLGLDGVELRINSIGDRVDREPYLERLRAYLAEHLDDVDEDVRRQRDLNPLRAFDTKDPASAAVMADAPVLLDHLGEPAASHFDEVRRFLDARGIAYVVDPTLVRGLDYYTRTTWEVSWAPLGAQSGIGGGGRYDGLAEAIGGAPTPGVGFASGLERVLVALEDQGNLPDTTPTCDVFFVILSPELRPGLHAAMAELRAAGATCEADLAGRSAKGQFKQADRSGAALAVVCGDDEAARGVVRLKDMVDGDEQEVPRENLVERLLDRIGAR